MAWVEALLCRHRRLRVSTCDTFVTQEHVSWHAQTLPHPHLLSVCSGHTQPHRSWGSPLLGSTTQGFALLSMALADQRTTSKGQQRAMMRAQTLWGLHFHRTVFFLPGFLSPEGQETSDEVQTQVLAEARFNSQGSCAGDKSTDL